MLQWSTTSCGGGEFFSSSDGKMGRLSGSLQSTEHKQAAGGCCTRAGLEVQAERNRTECREGAVPC